MKMFLTSLLIVNGLFSFSAKADLSCAEAQFSCVSAEEAVVVVGRICSLNDEAVTAAKKLCEAVDSKFIWSSSFNK